MARRSRLPLTVVAVVLLLAPNAKLDAQVGRNPVIDATTSSVAAPRRLPVVVAMRESTTVRAATSVVVVSVSSNALTVVSVPVPESIPASDAVDYVVSPLLGGAVVGQLTGSVGAGAAPRAIVFALRTPRRLLAGPVDVARVRFSTASRSADISVVANVAQARGVTISFASKLVAASAGAPVRIGYRLTNTGNAPDTVTVQAVVPPGWRVLDALDPIPLQLRESVDRGMNILPPHSQGVTTLRLVVLSRGQPIAEASIDVLVAGGAAMTTTAGPTLRVGIAAAVGPWAGASTIQSLELQGPIADGLTIRARSSSTPAQDAANYAFSRAGLGSAPFALQLASSRWRLDAGTLGTTVSDLSGVNLVGRGASLVISSPRWSATGVAVNPDIGFLNAGGSLRASRLEFTPGMFSLNTALSRLRETRGTTTRALDAWSLGGGVPDLLGGRWDAELAHRQYDGESAPGWSASYARRTPDETFDVRYVHAPGGTRAFARAVNEFSVNANRKLTPRLHLTGNAWRSSDQGAESLNTLSMEGWSLGARVALDDRMQVAVTAHQNGFGASTNLGEFGSAERVVDATLEARRGAYTAQFTANVASLERRTTLSDTATISITQTAPRVGTRGLIAFAMKDATIAVTGQYDRTGPGVGAAPVQWSYGLRFDGRPELVGQPVRVDASIERIGGAFGAARSLMIRTGVEVDLPWRTTIRMSAERNPYVVPGASASDWTYVIGVARALALPRLGGSGTRGVVYRDVNGNGRRESGEPGFPGVMLRRGTNVAVTDNRGAFVLMGNPRDHYEVDARSLPLGWISSSTVVRAETRLIGAMSVSPLEVELALDEADSARVSPDQLADLVVTVRDSTGREWMSRRLSNTRVVFDAIPPGTYTVVVDASAVNEPLRPTSELRPVVVSTGRVTPPIRVVMRARTLRFSNPRRGQ